MNFQNKFSEHFWHMNSAFERAEQALFQEEVPVGAVIISNEGNLIGQGFNQKENENDPTAHAEIIAIRDAAKNVKNWRLLNSTLYVTLEPCPMCFNAILQARIKTVVFGAYDIKGGSISLGYNFHLDQRLNHKFNILGGIEHYKCSKLLSSFFKKKRQNYKDSRSLSK
jgi:tRNA(adenine34) deaminase